MAKASTAASNVFQGALDNASTAKSQNANIKEQYPQLPNQLAEGLAQVAAIYVPDLAQSMNDNAAAKPDPKDLRFTSSIDPKTGLPLITTDYKAIDQLMHQFMPDPRAAGLFEGGMDGYMATAAQNQKANPTAAGDTLRQLAMLDGQMQNVREDMQYTPAAKKDEQANKAAMWTWVARGVLSTFVPGEAEGAVVSNAILKSMSTSIAAAPRPGARTSSRPTTPPR